MEAVVAEREAKGMKEIAIQEKDLTLQWRGNTGKLVKVRLKNTRAMEMWYNKQITEENIQEITTLNIIKNSRGHLFSGNANGRSVLAFLCSVFCLRSWFWDYYHNDYGDRTKYSGA